MPGVPHLTARKNLPCKQVDAVAMGVRSTVPPEPQTRELPHGCVARWVQRLTPLPQDVVQRFQLGDE
eukprot:6077085-Pyramimonas_sp.AAC.1